MGRIKEALNRLIVIKGGSAADSSVAALLKLYVKRADDVDVPTSKRTLGDVLEYVADVLGGTCKATVVCIDSVSEDPVTPTSVTIKTGTVIGSGTAVSPSGGKYALAEGSYNYSVSADGYTTKTGTFSISEENVISGALTLEISLVLAEE